MRILRIYPFLPPLRGGMEKHVLRLTEEQRQLGCEVVIAYNQGDCSNQTDIQVAASFNFRRIKPQSLRDMIFYGLLFIKLLARRDKFDVVHVHGDWSAFILGRMIAVFLKAEKLVASIHGEAKRTWIYQSSLHGYDLVYCTGARDAKRLSSLENIAVHWRHSGIDRVYIDAVRGSHSDIDVIYVGSFVQVKNISLILDIAERMPDVLFQLVGDGPQLESIITRCNKEGLKNVSLTGSLSSMELAERLCGARIFLLTSFAEGTPTAMLEAMACGLAIVTSESSDYSDLLIDGRNGYIVHGFDPEDYVSKVRGILRDPMLFDEMSARNRDEALSFGWSSVARKITEWMRLNGS